LILSVFLFLDFSIILCYGKYMKKISYSRYIKLSFIALFISVILLGLNLTVHFEQSGKMSHCPFQNNENGLCPMTIMDHIIRWNNSFIATKTTDYGIIFILSLLAFAYIFFRIVRTTSPPKLFFAYYHKEKPSFQLFSYFIEFFSRGILHPKIFA